MDGGGVGCISRGGQRQVVAGGEGYIYRRPWLKKMENEKGGREGEHPPTGRFEGI